MKIAPPSQTAKHIWEKDVEKQISRIRSDDSSFNRAALRLAETSVFNRFAKHFFEAAYSDIYGSVAVAERSFINIGPGTSSHPYWTTVDKRYGDNFLWAQMRRQVQQSNPDLEWDILDRTQLPFSDASIDLAYCSHVIEHVWDDDIHHLFRAVNRVLRPGAVFRLVCPDADLLARAYSCGDWWYFLDYLMLRARRLKLNQMDINKLRDSGFFARFVLEQVSLVTTKGNPFFVTQGEAPEFLASFPTLTEAFERASKLSDSQLNRQLGAHVNWLNFSKLQNMLKEAGFSVVERSGYRQSRAAVLRDDRFFDRTDPQMSLFVDAIK
jgi:SAM-dependent methyltransferase